MSAGSKGTETVGATTDVRGVGEWWPTNPMPNRRRRPVERARKGEGAEQPDALRCGVVSLELFGSARFS